MSSSGATFASLRRQVDTLCRKYAAELEVYRLRTPALEFCDEMAEAMISEKKGPQKPPLEWALLFGRKMQDGGFRLRSFNGLIRYMERCLERRILPQLNDLLRAILPKTAARGLIPRSIQQVPF